MVNRLAALALALAPIAAGGTECTGKTTKEDEIVRDIHLPGSYSPGLCGGRAEWLITWERSPSGIRGDECVSPEVGKRQTIGTPFQR